MFSSLRHTRKCWVDWIKKAFFWSHSYQVPRKRRCRHNDRQRPLVEGLEDRCLLAAPNLYLQSVVPEGTGFATNVSPGGTALVTTNGELTVQFATGLTNFSTAGFDGATLYFMYDRSVFAPLSSIYTPINVSSLQTGNGAASAYGLAKEININNTLLANATYANGG